MSVWKHVQLHHYDISDSDDSKHSYYCLLGYYTLKLAPTLWRNLLTPSSGHSMEAAVSSTCLLNYMP
jgi:hypothetical protein